MTPTEFLTTLRPTLKLRNCPVRQIAILALLAEAGQPINYVAAAKNLGISQPAIYRNIDTLTGKKLINRSWPHSGEAGMIARSVFIGITPQGTAFLEAMGVVA